MLWLIAPFQAQSFLGFLNHIDAVLWISTNSSHAIDIMRCAFQERNTLCFSPHLKSRCWKLGFTMAFTASSCHVAIASQLNRTHTKLKAICECYCFHPCFKINLISFPFKIFFSRFCFFFFWLFQSRFLLVGVCLSVPKSIKREEKETAATYVVVRWQFKLTADFF